MASLSERLLQAKADAILEYKAKIGSLSGFDQFWAGAETDILGTLHEQMQCEQAAADDTADLDWRSDAQKSEFITKHGLPAFQALLVKRATQGVK